VKQRGLMGQDQSDWSNGLKNTLLRYSSGKCRKSRTHGQELRGITKVLKAVER